MQHQQLFRRHRSVAGAPRCEDPAERPCGPQAMLFQFVGLIMERRQAAISSDSVRRGRNRHGRWFLSVVVIGFLPLFGQPQALNASWPAFRGPTSTGMTEESVVGQSSGADPRVAWSVPVHGAGHSSPIADGGRVFVSTAYLDYTAQRIESLCCWLAGGVTVCLGAMVLLHSPGNPSRHFGGLGFAVRAWALLAMVTVGFDVLGCRNDTLRAGLFVVLLAALGLDTARVLTQQWGFGQAVLALLGQVVSLAAAVYFLRLPFLRMPLIVFTVCLVPLACTSRCLVTLVFNRR